MRAYWWLQDNVGMLFATAATIALGVAICLALVGCPPKPVTPPVPATTIGDCADDAVVGANCEGLFTQDGGLACFICAKGEACVHKLAKVYCVKGACLADERCASAQ